MIRFSNELRRGHGGNPNWGRPATEPLVQQNRSARLRGEEKQFDTVSPLHHAAPNSVGEQRSHYEWWRDWPEETTATG